MEFIEHISEDTTIRTKLDPPPLVSALRDISDYIVLDDSEGRMILGIRRLSPISSCMCRLQDALHKAGFINKGRDLLDRFAVDYRENNAAAHYENVTLVQLHLFEIVFQILFGGVD